MTKTIPQSGSAFANKTGVSYFGNRNPRHFVSDLEEIIGHNCNFIVHTFSENDQEYYKDTIGEMIALSKDAGLECYLDPWGIGRVFGGEAYSKFALLNRDACQIFPDGKLAPAACLNHPLFRDFMKKWIDDAVDIGAQVLFWDEPHFFINLKEKERFAIWHCRCGCCSERFFKRFQKSFAEATVEEITLFRDESVVEFLTELCELGRAKGVKNALCLLPFRDAALGLSDWSKAAAIPAIDIFGTDPYWVHFNKNVRQFVGDYAREVQRLSNKYQKESQIWIQAYNIPAGREEELKEAIAVAYAEGVRNFAAWSYYGNAYMSYNRSENPQRVWDVLGEVYGELLRGEWE